MSENVSTSEGSSSSSWSDLLAQLIRGFVLLRDIFGYVLPGAFFLLIGAMLNRLQMFGYRPALPGAESHPWLLVFLLFVISYLSGQFLVSASYLIEDVPRVFKKLWPKVARKTERADEQRAHDRADFLRFHREFQEIYIEYDRQAIIALLRRGLAASVVFGLLVFYYLDRHPIRVIAGAGAIMVFNAVSGYFHLKRLKGNTLRAARDADAGRRPAERT